MRYSLNMADEEKPAKPARDVVLLGPPTADGDGVHVLRARDERIETGELRNVTEGKPITGELVTLQPRKDNPRVCDVTDSFKANAEPSPSSPPPARGKGPAQVATKAYRDNWEEVFASRKRTDLN
jgi:hypothetical protein